MDEEEMPKFKSGICQISVFKKHMNKGIDAVFKKLAEINPDPKSVRTMLLIFKDPDEGRIDKDTLKRLIEEFKNPKFNREEFLEKYPILNPSSPKQKEKRLLRE